MPKMFLRLPQVIEITGLKRSTVYERINQKSSRFDETFPRPVQLSANGRGAVAWLCSEIEVWMEQRANSRMEGGAR